MPLWLPAVLAGNPRILVEQGAYRSPEWKAYLQLNELRTQIFDYGCHEWPGRSPVGGSGRLCCSAVAGTDPPTPKPIGRSLRSWNSGADFASTAASAS
jgi:hypothetical protein